MMRESEQNQRMKSQGDLVPDRKAPLSSLTNTNSNIPLMNLTPTHVSNTSSTLLKDLTSSLFDPNAPSIQMSQWHVNIANNAVTSTAHDTATTATTDEFFIINE